MKNFVLVSINISLHLLNKIKNKFLGMTDGKCGLPRGRGVGGSSLINYMLYSRGNRKDFDSWGKENPGWSYKDVLPYFIKSENTTITQFVNSPYHGHSGPLNVEYVSYKTTLANAYFKAAKQAGHKSVDFNGESQMGVSYVQASTKNGIRQSAYTAYLKPIIGKRKNLDILSHARVTKVLIHEKTRRAYGIKMIHNKINHKIFANKEVILSAGAFSSPQILMLSGIGPEDELKKHNIKLLQNLPVGEIMFDHIAAINPSFITNTTNQSIYSSRVLTPDVINNYFLNRAGPFTSIGGSEILTFINSKSKFSNVPECELIFVPYTLASIQKNGPVLGWRISDETYDAIYKPLESGSIDTFSLLVMLFHPKSKGKLKLKNKDPYSWLRFYPNYFDDEEDVETLLKGIKEAIRITKFPALQSIGTRVYDTPIPACKHFKFGSDDYWRCSIKALPITVHHQVGTCKMGPANDNESVVNNKLKVYGIKRLRVVDAGIIPSPPTAHTNAPVFMIAEKASDIIKKYYHE